MLARPRMSVTQWVRPRQGILIRSILPLFLFTPHKMTRAGEGKGHQFALNCGPTSERKRKTKHVPFGVRSWRVQRAGLQRERDKSDVQSKPIDRSSPEPLFTPEPSLLGLRQPLP